MRGNHILKVNMSGLNKKYDLRVSKHGRTCMFWEKRQTGEQSNECMGASCEQHQNHTGPRHVMQRQLIDVLTLFDIRFRLQMFYSFISTHHYSASHARQTFAGWRLGNMLPRRSGGGRMRSVSWMDSCGGLQFSAVRGEDQV